VKRALLIVDMLNDFVDPKGSLRVPAAEGVVPAIARELAGARARGEPVIFLCDAHREADPEFRRMGWPPHAVRGTWGAAVVPSLAPGPGEAAVEKSTYSGFYGTRLAEVLAGARVDTVRLCGCVTNICVLYTAADAAMRGYDVEVVREALAGLAAEDHEFALRQMRDVLGARLV